MCRYFFFFALVLALLAFHGPALADPYFDGNSIPHHLIAPPPLPDSDLYRQELEQIIQLQTVDDPYQIDQAASERMLSPELVTLVAMPSLTREQFPAVYALLERVADTSKTVVKSAKESWNTKRPFQADERVKALIEPHHNPAYPSGHTAGSYLWAHVLSLLLPEQHEDFIARAEQIAQHRVVVGMHFPHDVEGGKQLALIMMGGLLQNQEFQKDLAAAKAEIVKSAAR